MTDDVFKKYASYELAGVRVDGARLYHTGGGKGLMVTPDGKTFSYDNLQIPFKYDEWLHRDEWPK